MACSSRSPSKSFSIRAQTVRVLCLFFVICSAHASDDGWDFWSRGVIFVDDTGKPFSPSDDFSEFIRVTSLPERQTNIPALENRTPETERLIEKLIASERHSGNRIGRPEMQPSDFFNMQTHMLGCPFKREAECKIWQTKPHVMETFAPETKGMHPEDARALAVLANTGREIKANAPGAAPLLDRYKTLLAASRACCTEGMAYRLGRSGTSAGSIYKFLMDDANFFQFGERCLMTTDEHLMEHAPDAATAELVAGVRDTCLCRGRQWFTALLAPFTATPELANQSFSYTYNDGLRRTVTVSIQDDVHIVRHLLSNCP
jgi:hypothetical protein